MKKAFSLIEIIQTVVLLGIIAGLSVSFFKKINSDQKLFLATQKQLTSTIREVGHKMCNDETPVCRYKYTDGMGRERISYIRFNDLNGYTFPIKNSAGADVSINDWSCSRIYGNGNNWTTQNGYCKTTNTPVSAPTVQSGNVPYKTKDEGATWEPMSYASMIRDTDNKYFVAPPCPTLMDSSSGSYAAKPMNTVVCPEGEPNYNAEIAYKNASDGSLSTYNAFCYYFWKTVAHKPQGVNEEKDLEKTCREGASIFDDKDILPTGISSIISSVGEVGKDNYNMLLPNGAYLYNLSSGPNDIIIKYDRTNEMATANYNASKPKETTIRVYSYTKAIYNGGNGEVTSADDFNEAVIDSWKNRNDDDVRVCPNGGLYVGINVDKSPICRARTEEEIKKCKANEIKVEGVCQSRPTPPPADTDDTGSSGTSTKVEHTTQQ